MNQYEVHLKDGTVVIITSKNVKVRSDNVLIFYSPRESFTDNYIHGPKIIATFNANQYSHFYLRDIHVD